MLCSMFLHKDFMPYVVALYRQAVEENQLPEIVLMAQSIATALDNQPELKKFLKIPFIAFEEKNLLILSLLPATPSQLFASFLTILGQNRKLFSLPAILAKFIEYAEHKTGTERVYVRSAFALDAATATQLKAAIESQLQRPVQLNVTIEPELLGGIVINYYRHELDLSLRHTVFSLKSRLKETYL